jgi:regulator of RNase E activity RraB
MTAPWTADFDFYATQIEDERAFIALDLGAQSAAPVATHSHRLLVRVRMLAPRPDGLRSSEEADALFALEDTIVERLAPLDALQVGRIVHGGYSTFVFYVPEATDDGRLRRAFGDTQPYVVEVGRTADADWSFYFGFLWPDPYGMQSIQNRRLLHVRGEHGDKADVPREVDHLAIFDDEKKLREAATALERLGFRLDAPECDDATGEWRLQFHRDDRVDAERADAFTTEILDVVLPLDGIYDGWGATIEK